MPIKVACTSCHAALRVPDTAAGKKIKCPKCGEVLRVPDADDGEQVESTGPATAAAKNRTIVKKPSRDDGNDIEDRPNPRRRKRAAASNKALWLGLGIGGAVVVILAVVAVILLTSGSGAEVPSTGKKQGKNKAPAQVKEPDEPANNNIEGGPAGPIERTTTEKRLSQLGLALHLYHDEVKSFPMPTVGGKGKLSWRVALLPYLEQRPLHSKFKLDEAWDSEHNLNVLNTYPMPTVFEPARTKPGEDNKKTYYQLFTGPGTCFPSPDTKLRMGTITDGPSNTWLLAEAKTPVEWTRPEELEVKGGKLPALGGVFGGEFYVLCADAKPHLVRRNDFTPEQMLLLINPSDGTVVPGWPPD